MLPITSETTRSVFWPYLFMSSLSLALEDFSFFLINSAIYVAIVILYPGFPEFIAWQEFCVNSGCLISEQEISIPSLLTLL